MGALPICLIIIGIVVIVISCFISDKVAEERMKQKAEELITSAESQELIRRQARETVEEVIGALSEDIAANAERELSRLSNEKIMAVHDYSETVLGEINKNHNEVMFLYSMLDDKDKEIRKTVSNLDRTVKKAGRNGNATAGDVSLVKEQSTVSTAVNTNDVVQQTLDMYMDSVEATDTENAKNINDNSRETILKLSREGYSNVEIAKMLKMGIGEVQLIVGLFQGADK